ncbi:transposase [Aeromonas piscicola]|uniref:transposase n=1 Tax=Aeromonas piscicola TaxID=600645 RepID=UPI0009E2EF91|nr:transposase [Aeromonas piscicola]
MTHRALWLVLAASMLAACTSTASLTDAELSQAAKQGDGRAQYELAKQLASQPDYPNAMHWMQQAAEQSGPLAADQQIRANAAWQVGDWYQAGLGEPKNPALATQWWQRSARLGNAQASYRTRQPNALNFDVRTLLYQLVGIDLIQIHGIGPYLALRLVAECGTDLSRWRTAQHFTSWLTLAPGCRISGGKVLSAHTRKTKNRVTAHLRLAAVTIGRTNTALGAFYRRLSARIGKAKAVTATARKIAVLFYNAMRFGMNYQDPGADHYEQQYRDRVVKGLHRRAAEFGFTLQAIEGVS